MSIQGISKAWHKWSWLCHIIGYAVIFGAFLNNVNAYDGRISGNAAAVKELDRQVIDLKGDLREIKESLRWIEKSMGRK